MTQRIRFLLFFLTVALSHPLRAESPSDPISLLGLSAWADAGDWAMAAEVNGSTQEMKWKSIVEGDKILYNGAEGKTINLQSKIEHGDVELEVEFMIPKRSNSGIYLMGRYEVQILDSYGKADSEITVHDCGAIYERWDDSSLEKHKGFEGTPPTTNASTAPGTWQKFEIRFRAPRFDSEGKKTENARFISVVHNGVVLHEDVEASGPTRGGNVDEAPFGALTIQGDHGPVAFRKLIVRHARFD